MKWLLDFIPYWLWIIIAGGALIATFPLWSGVWALMPKTLKVALGTVVAVGVAYLAGRNRGVSNEKQRQKDADAKAVKRRLDTNAEVDHLPAADRDRELGKWMRD